MNLDFLAQNVLFPLLAVAMFFAVIRLLRGPSLPDRVVALDLFVALGIGFVAVHAIVEGQPAFLDIAMVLALVAFLGTVTFALYIEKKGSRR